MNIPNRNVIDTNNIVNCVTFSVTLAELNAGKTLLAPDIFRRIRVVGFFAVMNGTFTTLTDARLSDITTAGTTSVDIATVVAAQMGTGVRHSEAAGVNVLGAGFNADLPFGSGVQLRKTGGTAAGGTSIDGRLFYIAIDPR